MLHALCRAGHSRDTGGPLPIPRAGRAQPCCCAHSQHRELDVLPSGDTLPLQDTSLKATLCRGFCYSFPEQGQHGHSPPWKLLARKQHSCLEATPALSQDLGRASCVPEQPAVLTLSPPWGYLPATCTQKHPMRHRQKPNIQKHVAFSRDLGSKQKLKLFSPRKPVGFHRIEMSISLAFP